MAEPGRRGLSGLDAPGCADLRRLIAVTLQAVPPAFAAYLASGCDDAGPAAAMLGLVLSVIQHFDDTIRNVDVGQAVIDERCALAVEHDREDRRPAGYPLRAV